MFAIPNPLKPATDAVTELINVAVKWTAAEPFQRDALSGAFGRNGAKKDAVAVAETLPAQRYLDISRE